MKLYKNMVKNAGIAIEILYYHMNMNIRVSHADSMLSNAKTNSLKFNGKKLILSIE